MNESWLGNFPEQIILLLKQSILHFTVEHNFRASDRVNSFSLRMTGMPSGMKTWKERAIQRGRSVRVLLIKNTPIRPLPTEWCLQVKAWTKEPDMGCRSSMRGNQLSQVLNLVSWWAYLSSEQQRSFRELIWKQCRTVTIWHIFSQISYSKIWVLTLKKNSEQSI